MSSRNSRENVLAGLEHQLAEAKKRIEFASKVHTFTATSLFQEVMVEGYFKNVAAGFVCESADPTLSAEQRADALNMAQAPGHLKRWLHTLFKFDEVDKDSIAQLEEQIDMVRAAPADEFEE